MSLDSFDIYGFFDESYIKRSEGQNQRYYDDNAPMLSDDFSNNFQHDDLEYNMPEQDEHRPTDLNEGNNDSKEDNGNQITNHPMEEDQFSGHREQEANRYQIYQEGVIHQNIVVHDNTFHEDDPQVENTPPQNFQMQAEVPALIQEGKSKSKKKNVPKGFGGSLIKFIKKNYKSKLQVPAIREFVNKKEINKSAPYNIEDFTNGLYKCPIGLAIAKEYFENQAWLDIVNSRSILNKSQYVESLKVYIAGATADSKQNSNENIVRRKTDG